MSTTSPSLPTTGTWKIDSVHSSASITVPHNVVAKFRGSFNGVSGTLENGVLSGSVPVESIDIILPPFRGHVLSEFFDAENHPTLDFRSTELHAHADGTLHLNGELTVKGITKPISATGTVAGPQEVSRSDGSSVEILGLSLTSTVDRREFGQELPAGTGWDVTINVDLELAKA